MVNPPLLKHVYNAVTKDAVTFLDSLRLARFDSLSSLDTVRDLWRFAFDPLLYVRL